MSLMPLCHCGSVLGHNMACETCNDYANSYKRSTCPDCGHDDCQCAAVSACLPPGSRRAEVDITLEELSTAYVDWENENEKLYELARTLANEVDELRGKLDDVRMNIGCARGQRSTQFCAEAAQRDRVISALLLAMKPGEQPQPEQYEGYDQLFRERLCRWNDSVKRYARACEIAGRAE